MWKVFNKLFGWDYVLFGTYSIYKIYRVHCTEDGAAFIKVEGDLKVIPKLIPVEGVTTFYNCRVIPLTKKYHAIHC